MKSYLIFINYWMMSDTLWKENVASVCSFKLVTVIASGLLIHLALGSVFTFGNMAPYIVSYLRNRTEDTSLRNIDALWLPSIGSPMIGIGMMVGGLMDRQFGPRIATLIGSLIYGGTVLLTSVAVKISMVFVMFSYGLVLNFGGTMAYGPPIQTAIKWMPKRTTLAAGMIVAGYGGGALIFNQVITAYINPDNLSPDQISETGERYFTERDLLDRVPTCFLILGACYLTMTLVGVLGLELPDNYRKHNEEEAHQLVNQESESYSNESDAQREEFCKQEEQTEYGSVIIEPNTSSKIEDMTIWDTIKITFRTRAFHILLVAVMALDGAYLFLSLYKAYGQTFIEDDHFLALVGSLSAIFNCLGRPFWGSVMDKFGYKVTVRCIAGVFAITSATLVLTEHMHKTFFLIWICTLYFFFCGIWAVAPSTLSKLFGPNNMAINYGFITVATSVASLVGGIAGLTIKDRIGWHGLFYLSAGLSTIPFVLTFFFNGQDLNGKRI